MRVRTLVAAALLGTTIVGAAGAADAQTWQQRHPRRVEVNSRLARQHQRERQGVRSGQLSHAQARTLHADDHAIRTEERADAAAHGGHITRGEQHRINRQENANSRAIHAERRAGS